MKVVNQTSRTLRIAETGKYVDPGGTVEVPKDLGQRLCEQSDVWKATTSAKTTKDES